MAEGNTNFGTDGLLATTIDHYVRKMEEASWNKTVLMHLLAKNGMPSQNGNKIVQPLLYGEIDSKGSYSDDDVFTAPTRGGVTAAEFDWKQYYASVMITGIEKAKNAGREQILSLLKTRLRQAELSIAKDVNSQLFGDGTGNGGDDFDGLEAVIDDANTYGGIDRTDVNNAFWEADVTDHGAAALSLAALRTSYNNVMDGVEKATNIVTTQAGFEAYEALLTDQIRYEDTELGDAGFDNLMFKSAPIVFDRACTAGTFYFLNMDYIEVVKLDNTWFTPSEWLRPTNQDAQYKNIYLYGNLTTSNAERHAKLHNVSDA